MCCGECFDLFLADCLRTELNWTEQHITHGMLEGALYVLLIFITAFYTFIKIWRNWAALLLAYRLFRSKLGMAGVCIWVWQWPGMGRAANGCAWVQIFKMQFAKPCGWYMASSSNLFWTVLVFVGRQNRQSWFNCQSLGLTKNCFCFPFAVALLQCFKK